MELNVLKDTTIRASVHRDLCDIKVRGVNNIPERCGRSVKIDFFFTAINYTRHKLLRAKVAGGFFPAVGPQLTLDSN
jgi:hypothetical protein